MLRGVGQFLLVLGLFLSSTPLQACVIGRVVAGVDCRTCDDAGMSAVNERSAPSATDDAPHGSQCDCPANRLVPSNASGLASFEASGYAALLSPVWLLPHALPHERPSARVPLWLQPDLFRTLPLLT